MSILNMKTLVWVVLYVTIFALVAKWLGMGQEFVDSCMLIVILAGVFDIKERMEK